MKVITLKDLKVIFMGTPSFSVPILENLIKNANVLGVVTAPDALIGRKKVLTASPIKMCAQKYNIPVFTPVKLKEDYESILELNPDIIITCAYGQIVPKVILDTPKYGCINIHASLLPKYRGASPIQSAIINGEKETGITLMYMAEGLDTGDIIKEKSIKIDDVDNLETLSNKLSILASNMIIEELPNIINGKSERIPQDNDQATYVGLIKREDEHLDFNIPAIDVYNKVRAFAPSPLANFILDDLEYKVGLCEVTNESGSAGLIISEDKNSFTIACQVNAIKILKIKPLGKNLMDVKDFKNGYHDKLVGKVVK